MVEFRLDGLAKSAKAAVETILRPNPSLANMCRLSKIVTRDVYTHLSVEAQRAIEIIAGQSLPIKAIVLAGEFAGEQRYLRKKLERTAESHSAQLIAEEASAPATVVGWMGWRLMAEGYRDDDTVLSRSKLNR